MEDDTVALSDTGRSYLTSAQLAMRLGLCVETIRRRVRSGAWPALMIGNRARFGPEEIAAIRELSVKRPPAPRTPSSERRARNKRLRNMTAFRQD